MIPNDHDLDDLSDGSASNLMEYAYLFWRWAWLIVVVAMVAGGAVYIVSKSITPVYQTITRLLVSNPPSQGSIDTTAMISGTTMTQTYSQMLSDTPVLNKVIEKLNLKMTSKDLAGAISVSVVLNTQIISVSVEDVSPTRAVDIANMLGTVFADRILQLQADRYSATLLGLQKQVDDMSKQIDDTNAKIALEVDPAQKLQLETRLTEYRKLYSSLVSNYEQVRLAEAQTSTSVAVVQPAQLPTAPVWPRTMQFTLEAALVGMLLAMGVVFAIDALDGTIKNPEEILQKFGLPILGVIAEHTQLEGQPITQEQPRSPVAEAFRTLRTNVKFSSVDAPLRRIIVTSPTPQDGKTTISVNLGIVFAQSEKKVVLIDADLRRPQQHKRFGLPNQIGLSDAMVRQLDDLPQIIQSTGVPGLMVITSGALPPNPAELLGSNKMLQVIDRLVEEFDLAIIDTPPVLTVTDAVALAPAMDGVILVAKPGVTRLAAFKQTLVQLQGVGARILGVVLNEVEPNSRKYGYYYHRYYSQYSYYYSADGTKKKKSHNEPAKGKELKQD
jgi:non-specific protein-tyrosine kinase